MYIYFFRTFLLMLLILLVNPVLVGASSCTIINGPIPELADYTRRVDVSLSEILALSKQEGNGCGLAQSGSVQKGASANAEKVNDTIARAFSEVPIFDDMGLDFTYNFKMAVSGDTRAPVLRDGTLFIRTRDRINSSLSNVVNSCNLTDNVRKQYVALIIENRTLENIFRQAALGAPVQPSGLSPENMIFAQKINEQYIPTKTESCKSSTKSEEIIDKITKTSANLFGGNAAAWKEWETAKALYQGGGKGMTNAQYVERQRQILQAELSRQGYSQRTSQAILSNFDCVKARTAGSNNPDDLTRAERQCLVPPLLGIEESLLSKFKQMVVTAPTTTARVDAMAKLGDARISTRSIQSMYLTLAKFAAQTRDTKEALMLELIDTHLSLIATVEAINKRLPQMYQNCMKAQSSIPCPKP